ncbi:MAG: glycoside hydrolase family 32 protein [Bacillota bacterium]
MNDNKNNKNYTSKVPQFSFDNDLEKQKKQLQNNPLIKRFKESRKKMADDPYRPHYHFVSPESTLNDPNGLCYWKEKWHLFYQGYPPEDPRQHWGHAISDDLIHWRDLPYAIYPEPEECCFSGTTYVEKDRVIAMYHGTKGGNMVAVSDDPLLLNWKKLTGKPVIPFPEDSSSVPYNIFDPCIWKKDGIYYSLSAGTLPHEPSGRRTRADFLFKSKDLKKWEYIHPFVEGDRFTLNGDDGACPYFWPIGDRYILLFFSHMSGGQALLGNYDKKRNKFIVTEHFNFNFGPATPGGIHAPSATPDGKNGINVIFNMNPAKPTKGWDQIMSLPRNLTLIDKHELGMKPAGDYKSLRYNHIKIKRQELPANQEILLDNVSGKSLEIKADINTQDAPMVELNVLRSPDREEYTRIAFYRERGYRDWEKFENWNKQIRSHAFDSLITVDNSYSSILSDVKSRAPETAPVFLNPDESLQLHVFIDRSVVEVFVNGKQCVAVRVYPGREDSNGVSLYSRGKRAILKSLDAWEMKNIYN